MIINPRRITWSRYRAMLKSPYNLLRALEIERLGTLDLPGKTLDVGGGEGSAYRPAFRVQGTYVSVNVDPWVKPAVVADVATDLPFAAGAFDNVVSLHTLEHVRDDVAALGRMVRVLRQGGLLALAVPFLHRVHAAPCDHHRHTAAWWEETLADQGLDPATVIVEPLMWDIVGSGFALTELWKGQVRLSAHPLKVLRRALALLWGAISQSSRWPDEERVPDPWGRADRDFALGYFLTGKKRIGRGSVR